MYARVVANQIQAGRIDERLALIRDFSGAPVQIITLPPLGASPCYGVGGSPRGVEQIVLLVPYLFASCARRAFAIIPELTAMALSDSAASSVPSSTRSSRSGVASPSSRRCWASLAELSASCRARCTPIVVGSVLLISLLS